MTAMITTGQLKRLQTLYGQLCAHTDQSRDRTARLEWAAALVLHPIASFHNLTRDDARHLIDTLQSQLHIAPTRGRRLDRAAAQKAGTEGRRGWQSNETTLAGKRDVARIQYVLNLLGWSEAQLDGWLRSPRSPLSHRSSPQIRTLADANRVWWALKRIAIAQGKWEKRDKS